jgi:hypothetical protein
VSAFAGDHTVALQMMMLTYTVGVTLWLVFGAAVWARMRSTLPTDSMLTTCFAAGMVSFVTLLLVGFTCFNILVYRQPPASEAKLLYDLTFGLLAMSGMPTAVALGAYAVAVHRHRIFARPTGTIAAAAAAAHVLLLLSFIVGHGFFSLEGTIIAAVPALLWTWIGYTASTLSSPTQASPRAGSRDHDL